MLTRTTRLPAKRVRPKMGIERAPKRDWPRHRKFVKTHKCCVPGCPYLGVPDCAHLRGVDNCGTSLKPPDWHTVPLCRAHHEQQEAAGPDAFGDRHGIDLWEFAANLARRSPDWRMRQVMLLNETEPQRFVVKRITPRLRPLRFDWFPIGDRPQRIAVLMRVS